MKPSSTAVVVVRRTLIAFLLVSIGYAFGREMTLRASARQAAQPPSTSAADTADARAAPAQAERLVVYYFHGKVRCVTCNNIERMTRAALAAEFGEQLRDGRIEWRLENFQENEELADHYDLVSSSVVLVRLRDGREAGFRRLDRVWELVGDPAAFADYVRAEVRGQLQESGG